MSDYCNYDNIEYIDIPYNSKIDNCLNYNFNYL